MAIPDSTYATLTSIIQDIRDLTRGLSPAQISDAKIMYWMNSFILYDFPASLRLSSLKTTFSFYTSPYIDVYQSTFTNTADPFYNFSNTYLTTQGPFYCAGYEGQFMQSQSQFYGLYPQIRNIQLLTYGDGATTQFMGVINALQTNQTNGAQQLNVCLVRNQVMFDSIDINNNGLVLVDTPISATIGNLSIPNNPPTSLTLQDANNYVNYLTGQFVITFNTPPLQGANVNSQSLPVAPARPQTLLWFDDQIILRPVPDQPYKIDIDAFIRPSALINAGDMPQLAQWYQYIVYGTATKIFQMRGDEESVARIAPEFKRQELLVMRTTIVQQAKQRVPTIFSHQIGPNYGSGFGYFGGNNNF